MSVSADEVEALGARGFFSRPAFLGESLARQAHHQAKTLFDEGRFTRASIGKARQTETDVRTDATMWVDAESCGGALLAAYQHFEALRLALNAQAWLGLQYFELQLAHYAPGGHYQRHLDSFSNDSARRVTAIVYLNPDWQPAHGGRLRLCTEPPLEVAPQLDSFVCFLSERVEHEVLTTAAERWALTAWYRTR